MIRHLSGSPLTQKEYGLFLSLVLLTLVSYSDGWARIPSESQIEVCFTPRQQCLPLILTEISKAKKEILVQAYQLTSRSIAGALKKAFEKGVRVRIIADKSQEESRQSQVPLLRQSGIDVLIDDQPRIAHNKVILIDGRILIGGSYNYSSSAEKKNAENVLVMRDHEVIDQYRQNWFDRAKVARKLQQKNP